MPQASVLSYRHLPVRWPIVGTLTWIMFLDWIGANPIVWGIWGTLAAFTWAAALYRTFTQNTVVVDLTRIRMS